jgi:hypothetical protein
MPLNDFCKRRKADRSQDDTESRSLDVMEFLEDLSKLTNERKASQDR